MSNSSQRPNYFKLLDLDPVKSYSNAEIRQALTEHRQLWFEQRNHPRESLKYRGYIDLFSDMEKVMLDPVLRDTEAAAARQRRSVDKAEAHKKLKQEISVLAAGGQISEAQIAALIKEYQADISPERIRNEVQRMLKIPLPEIEGEITPKAAKVNPLPTLKMNTIQKKLDQLHKRDLYDYLGETSSTPTVDLFQAVKKRLTDNRQEGDQNTLKILDSELAGFAREVFADEISRAAYDSARRFQPYAAVLDSPLTKIATADANKVMLPQQEQVLEEMALRAGLSHIRAQQYIVWRAKELGIEISIKPPKRGQASRSTRVQHKNLRRIIRLIIFALIAFALISALSLLFTVR